MSEELLCTHPDCQIPTPDGLLCGKHTERLRRDLAALPGLLRQLDVTLTRQAKVGNGAGKDRTPLPFDVRASEVGWSVRNTLQTWVRTIELDDIGDLADDPAEWARWLRKRIERIRGHAEGGMLADEIGYCVASIRRAIDAPPDNLYCGPCATCGGDLYARPSAIEVLCRRCERAGIVTLPVDVTKARKALRDRAEDMLVTRTEALRALPSMAGVDLPSKTLDRWVQDGRVVNRGGRVRLGDVLDAAAGWVARRRAS